MTETPQIINSCYSNSTTGLGEFVYGGQWQNARVCGEELFKRFQEHQSNQQSTPMQPNTINRRIVQVFIADPNENVPLDKSVLYTGEQKLTDLNDTELFFEVSIAEILKKHNELRVTLADREASKRAGKDVMLDPAKIRDLKMVVVTVAQF